MSKSAFIYIHGVTPDITTPKVADYSKKFHQKILNKLNLSSREVKRFEVRWASSTFSLKSKLGKYQFDKDDRRGFKKRQGALAGTLKNFVYPAVVDILYYAKNKGSEQSGDCMPIIDKLHRTVLEAKEQGYQNIILFAHSLGSVAVYDYLFRFEGKYPFPEGIKVERFISFGSPIGLFAAGMGYPLSTKIKRPEYVKKWVNLWDHDDPIATRCEPHFKRAFVRNFLKDISVNTAWINPLKAHLSYWSSKEVIEKIAEELKE